MNIEEYRSIFDETAIYPSQVDKFDLCYLYLGLIDELNELHDAVLSKNPIKILDESGDVFWYINGIDVITGIDKLADLITYGPQGNTFPDYSKQGLVIKTIHTTILDISRKAGWLKKYYRDDRSEIFGEIPGMLESVVGTLERTLGLYNFSIEEMMRYNYSKLSERKKKNTIHDIDRHE